MASFFRNAAPQNYPLGIDDKSIRQVPLEPEALPTHLPRIYIYASQGPTDSQLVVGNSMTALYGLDTFNVRSPYFTHATELAKTINSTGNAIMMQRVKPDDAGPNATLRLYLDVLKTQVPLFQREDDGSLVLDVNGDPVPTGDLVDGFKAMWVTDVVEFDGSGTDTFGRASIKAGSQLSDDGTEQSRRYPIVDLRTPFFGDSGNNVGFRLWSPDVLDSQPVDEQVIRTEKTYPYRFACLRREDVMSLGRVVETLSAEQYIDATFKDGVVDRRADREIGLASTFISSWQLLNDEFFPDQYGPFGELHVYENNVDTLTAQFYVAEKPFIDGFSDFDLSEDEHQRFNFVGGHSSQGVLYHSFLLVKDDPDATILSPNSVAYASGGSDGTMDETLFAKLVSREIKEYANPNSQLQDTARYPEAIFYDSGFPLATKYDLFSFIALRKDTALVVSVHDTLGPPLSASQESSLALSLKTYAQLFPESDFYGTPVARSMIVGRCGSYKRSKYRKKLPLTLEIALNAARYMGAGNGVWKPEYRFDNAPGSVVKEFTDINVTFTPAVVRNKDWDAGLVWVQSFERKSVFFPALKTVYDNDTSVLNSFFTMMACVELQKVGDRAWRRLSGAANLTNLQVIEKNNEYISEAVAGRFDDRFIIEPETYFTEADKARGYSWTTKVKIYAANMKTVATFTIESHRLDDYGTGQ